MLEAGEVGKSDAVVEVGPGFGVLTFALAEKAGKVVAFEIEKKIEEYWKLETRNLKLGNLEIVWGNVLKSLDCKLLPTSYKLIANLPYQITSPIIRTFLEAPNPPELMVLMVQKEVAERICAKPGDMSVLSVAVQYYADAEIVANVPRKDFWPSPQVDSAIIKVSLRGPQGRGNAHDIFNKQFFQIVKIGFANRRKLLFKNLLPVIGKKNSALLKEVFETIGLTPLARAQELSVEQWKQLVSEVSSKQTTASN